MIRPDFFFNGCGLVYLSLIDWVILLSGETSDELLADRWWFYEFLGHPHDFELVFGEEAEKYGRRTDNVT